MSAFEPHMPSEPKVDMPDFMVVLRGFDRRQVEMWAAEVANQIEQERLRADEAEKRAYRVEIDNKNAASFTHLGTHVASILEEAGRSSENMLADAADRAQETVEAAEEEAAEIIKAAEHRAGEIEGDARRTLEEARSEGARVEEDALQAAEEMRAQAEQDARTVLEEARDATDMIWQEAERERIGVEAETIRLETLRHRSLEQLGRVYGHLESVLDEVRAGIGRVEEEQEDLDVATAAAAARLGVEPPASSPEESPRFPDLRPRERTVAGDLTAGDDSLKLAPGDDPGELTAAGDPSDLGDLGDLGDGGKLADGGDGMLSATRPGTTDPARPGTADRPVLSDAVDDVTDGSSARDAELTQPALTSTTAETTQPTPATTTEPTPPAANGTAGPANGEAGPGPDVTQRLEPVGNNGPKSRPSKPASKESKGGS